MSLGNEITKGFGRGVGYRTASKTMDVVESVMDATQQAEMERIDAIGEGNPVRNKTSLSVWFYVIIVLCWQFAFIILPIYGFIRYRKDTTTTKRVVVDEVKVSDRRYKCGYRTEYHRHILKEKSPALPFEREAYRKQGKIMLIISGVFYGLAIILFILMSIFSYSLTSINEKHLLGS